MRRTGRGALVGCALAATLACALLAPPVRGQPGATAAAATTPAEPSPEDKETARTLYQQGHDRYRTGDFHGALASFKAADRIMGVPTTALEVGRTEAQLGLLVEARDHLLKAARYPAQAGEPEAFTRARQEAQSLSEGIARRIPSLQVDVLGPTGALTQSAALRIKIDGAELAADLRLVPRRLNPGTHVVQAAAPGLAPQKLDVVLRESEQRILQISLVAGQGAEPGTDTEPPEGQAEAGGGAGWPVAAVGFALGGAGLIVGAITGAMALSQEAELAERCPDQRCPGAEEDALDQARTIGHVSTASFIVGGVGVGVGIVALIVALSGDDDAPATAQLSWPLGARATFGLGLAAQGLGLSATF